MAADELTRPLGMRPPRRKRPWLIFLAIVLPPGALVAGLGFMWLGADMPPPSVTAIEAGGATTGTVAPHGSSMDDPGAEAIITGAGEPQAIRLAAAPRQDLVERTEYGLLPRIGEAGVRPLDAYARPAGNTAGMIPIALVVGGIGVEKGGTEAALERLPGAVTLAFVPYGDELSRLLVEARSAGHEVLLQASLEPGASPAVKPGAGAFAIETSREESLDQLRRQMSRITTYVGVMNYMGAAFTGEADGLAPLLAEIGSRGLLFVDDGSVARSGIADNLGPMLQTDLVLDGDAAPAAIDARLAQLVAIARERGFAVGIGTALAATVDRLAAFAASAGKRGIVLVPVSAAVQFGPS